MLEPITRSVTVECNQETAFNVFIKELGSWWPHAPFTVSAMKEIGVRSITVDAQVGGKIIETGEDGQSFTVTLLNEAGGDVVEGETTVISRGDAFEFPEDFEIV